MTLDTAQQINVRRNGSALLELDPQEREAIIQFRQEHGRRWKHHLLQGWMRAAFPGPLQRVRNNFGPEWLARVKEADFLKRSTVKENKSGAEDSSTPTAAQARQRM
jgi:hypothetical protein